MELAERGKDATGAMYDSAAMRWRLSYVCATEMMVASAIDSFPTELAACLHQLPQNRAR